MSGGWTMIASLLCVVWFAGALAMLGAGYLAVSLHVAIGQPLGVRMVLTIIAVLTGQYLVGLGLLLLGLFGAPALIAVFLASAAFLWHAMQAPGSRTLVAADLDTLRALFGGPSTAGKAIWLFAVPVCIAWMTIIRAVVSPPMDWDFLTYHGPRAAFWVQEGTLVHGYDAVGSWQVYQAFPIAGDLLSAWSMLLPSGDAAVAPTWIAVWLAIGLVAYATIRCLDGSRLHAALGAAVAVTIPGVFHHMSSGYVDNAVALALLAGTYCFAQAEKTRTPALATAAMVSWALAVAIKFTALPFLALGSLIWAWLHLRDRAHVPIGWTAGGVGLICATALAWPLYLFVTLGNPLYPFWFSLFGVTFAGATEPAREVVEAAEGLSFVQAAVSFFWNGFYREPLLHNGFGPGGLLVVLVGAIGLVSRGLGGRLAFTATTGAALAFLGWILATRINYPGLDEARYIVAALILATISVARLSGRPVSGLLVAVLAVNLVYALPWRWSVLDAVMVPLCLATGVAAAFIWRPKPGRSPWQPAAAFLAVSLITALTIASHAREMYFIGLARDQHFNSGPVAFSASAQAYPIWNAIAEDGPMVVAVTAGTWTRPTHWYVYPLLGSRLQHTLLHVPTGLYYPDERDAATMAEIDRAGRRWLAALEAAGADAVMVYAPDPVERGWIDANPLSFDLVDQSEDGASALFRIRRDGMAAVTPASAEPPQ